MSTVADLPQSAIGPLTGDQFCWTGSQDNQTREETFTWLVPWQDSNAFYNTVVGQAATISIGNTSITRKIPLQHPYNSNLYATKLDWKGKDGPGKPAGALVKWVYMYVTFGYLGYSAAEASQDEAPPFLKISAKSASQIVTDPGKKYQITPHDDPSSTDDSGGGSSGGTSSPVPYSANVAKRFFGQSYQISLFQIPDLAAWEELLQPLENCVNSESFTLGNFTRDAGTVLFESYEYEQTIDVLGNAIWTGVININYSKLPWNCVYKDAKLWDLSPAPYEEADLNSLYY